MSVEQSAERPRGDGGRFTSPPDFRATEISSAIDSAVDSGSRPADAFTPMKMATPEPPKETNFSDSVEGLRSAADELTKRRQAEQAPVIERGYQDAKTREKRPPWETRKLSEAADDLRNQRFFERDSMQEFDNSNLREQIDQYRAEQDAQEALAAHYARKEAEQAALEGDAVPEPQPTGEATPPAATNGIDPEVAKALENPKIRAALEQEATAHATARAQYLQSVQQLGRVQAASLLAEFPELASSANPQGTIELWRHSNPEKFAAVAGRLNQIQQVVNHWNGLQQQQHQQALQNFQAYSKGEDSKFEQWEKSRPAGEAKAVRDNLATVLKEDFGIDPQALGQLYNSHPAFRSVEAQRLIYSAVRHSLAEKAASKRGADPRIPQVFARSDASDRPTGQSAVVQEKMRQFAADPNPRNAAKALAARRRAASVLR